LFENVSDQLRRFLWGAPHTIRSARLSVIELSSAHFRKQFETFAEQSKHLTGLAQKVTTDAVEPLQAGMKSALSKTV
jgi:hypothetical protein